jgi:hypothetical protein
MFWIIENKEQLETFYLNEYKEVGVIESQVVTREEPSCKITFVSKQ